MKKAQLHISETIAVLFIFFILVVFGLIFYFKYQQVAFKDRQEEFLAARAMDITLKALFLPELMCSRGEAEPEDNCIDVHKARHANKTFGNENYYFHLFSYANLTLVQLYPRENPKVYYLYDKPKPAITKREPTYFVVTFRDETAAAEPQYGFGYLKVEVYS